MRGAIAAGHSLTAEAGARVLAEGGNAVDACIAAAFASSASGPRAGGTPTKRTALSAGRLEQEQSRVFLRSSVTGYRLSGADMQPWIGKRVQVIGMFAPAPALPSAVAPAAATGAPAAPPVLEFKVQRVQPITGTCPK